MVLSMLDMLEEMKVPENAQRVPLPDNWKDGRASGLRARGGITVEMKWSNKKVSSLVLTAQHRCEVTLGVNGEQKRVKLNKGTNRIIAQ